MAFTHIPTMKSRAELDSWIYTYFNNFNKRHRKVFLLAILGLIFASTYFVYREISWSFSGVIFALFVTTPFVGIYAKYRTSEVNLWKSQKWMEWTKILVGLTFLGTWLFGTHNPLTLIFDINVLSFTLDPLRAFIIGSILMASGIVGLTLSKNNAKIDNYRKLLKELNGDKNMAFYHAFLANDVIIYKPEVQAPTPKAPVSVQPAFDAEAYKAQRLQDLAEDDISTFQAPVAPTVVNNEQTLQNPTTENQEKSIPSVSNDQLASLEAKRKAILGSL